jgi:hypothetical protein
VTHICPDCGLDHGEPVIEAPEVDMEPAADAAVEIARLETERDVAVARIEAKSTEAWQEARVVELEAQLAAMRETVDRLAPPEPQSVPIVVEEVAPEPVVEPEPTVAPPPVVEEPAPRKAKGNPWFR